MSAAEQLLADRAEPPGARRRPWLAALLSLLAPGTGQFYNGMGRLGGTLFAAFVAADLAAFALLSHRAKKAAFLAMLLLTASELGLRLPGDRIQLRQGLLYVNGAPAGRRPAGDYDSDAFGRSQHFHRYVEDLPRASGEPPYQHPIIKLGDDGPFDNTPVYEVPAGHYFALGDNRDNSLDSRMLSMFGSVPEQNLVGHAEFLSFSTNGSARWWQIWRWPGAIRYSRILTDVR